MNNIGHSGTKAKYTTDELLSLLKGTAPKDASALKNTLDNISGELKCVNFHEYLHTVMIRKNMDVSELIIKTLLSRSFVYQIYNGQRMPGRDIVLRIALVMGLTVEETQRMLLIAKKGGLYPRVRRDAVIIYCLENKLGLYETDEMLNTLSEIPLCA